MLFNEDRPITVILHQQKLKRRLHFAHPYIFLVTWKMMILSICLHLGHIGLYLTNLILSRLKLISVGSSVVGDLFIFLLIT